MYACCVGVGIGRGLADADLGLNNRNRATRNSAKNMTISVPNTVSKVVSVVTDVLVSVAVLTTRGATEVEVDVVELVSVTVE
jgi:hypothetical protein